MNTHQLIKPEEKKYHYLIFIAVLVCLSLVMVCWYGPVTEYAGHDYFFNFRRFQVLIDALQSGDYPVYMDYNAMEGYGYFTKGFYPDLVLLPFAAIGILCGAVFAYNVLIFTLTLLCGLFMYKAVNSVFTNVQIASLSAILYTFSVYHLFDWYNRGALGEAISFTFLPLIFWGFYEIIKGDYRKWYILTIGYSLIIYTHLLSSFLTFATLVVLLPFGIGSFRKEPKRILYLLLAAVVTLPIVASYILPMLEQMASNRFNYSDAVNITGQTKLEAADIGWGMLSGILYPKESNLTGTGPLLVIILFLRLFIREKTRMLRLADLCLCIGIIYIIVMSWIFPWGRLPLGFIQFPWRLYEFVVLFFSIAGSYYLVSLLKSRKQYIIAATAILLFTVISIVVGNNNYISWQTEAKKNMPEWFTGIPSADNEYYLGGREYMPAKVPSYRMVNTRGDSIIATSGEASVYGLIKKKGFTRFEVETGSYATLELPLLYYKGYKVTMDDKKLSLNQSERGLLEIVVENSGAVTVYYTGTTLQRISWYTTIVSIFVLCIYIFTSNRKRTFKKEI